MSIKTDLILANEKGLAPPQNWTHRAIEKIQQLEQQNEALQASLDNCLQQNQEMLEWIRSATEIFMGEGLYSDEQYREAEAFITKIKRNSEAEGK